MNVEKLGLGPIVVTEPDIAVVAGPDIVVVAKREVLALFGLAAVEKDGEVLAVHLLRPVYAEATQDGGDHVVGGSVVVARLAGALAARVADHERDIY